MQEAQQANCQVGAGSNWSDQEIKRLLYNIQNLTIQMSNTFQQAILKHEQQFIKTYRIKISELIKLFEELTKVLEDKFINNALTHRLNIIIKERDYFKYQCLKINVQYQTAINQHSSLASQISNVTDQMKIYKHLLEDEKLRNKQLQASMDKFKIGFNETAYKTLSQGLENINPLNVGKNAENKQLIRSKNKKIQLLNTQLRQKTQLIRNLKIKISQLQLVVNQRQAKYFQNKQLYQTFKICVNAWKRDLLTKQRKNHDSSKTLALSKFEKAQGWDPQKLNVATKKQLLKKLFTSAQFLKFIEQLLFNPRFQVQFIFNDGQNDRFMAQNRAKLFEFMHKKKIIQCSGSFGTTVDKWNY